MAPGKVINRLVQKYDHPIQNKLTHIYMLESSLSWVAKCPVQRGMLVDTALTSDAFGRLRDDIFSETHRKTESPSILAS